MCTCQVCKQDKPLPIKARRSLLTPCRRNLNELLLFYASLPSPLPPAPVGPFVHPRRNLFEHDDDDDDGPKSTSTGLELDVQMDPHCSGHRRPVRCASGEEHGRARRRRGLGSSAVRTATRVCTTRAWRVWSAQQHEQAWNRCPSVLAGIYNIRTNS